MDCLLHIGLEKTGTTAIQHALSENEDVLVRENIQFIKAGRQRAAGMKAMKPPGVRGHRIVGSPSDHRLEDLLQASP